MNQAKEPIEECLKSILTYVDATEYPYAERLIKLMLENLFICGEIEGLRKLK